MNKKPSDEGNSQTNNAVVKGNMPEKEPLPQSCQLLPPYLQPGSDGQAVLAVQTVLIALGILDADIMSGDEAGFWGNKTVEGIKRIQEALGFEGKDIDGCFGPKTRERFAARLYIVSSVSAGEEFHFDLRRVSAVGHTVWFEPGTNELKHWPEKSKAATPPVSDVETHHPLPV